MSKKNNQLTLFDMKEWWEDDWEGMPEFVSESQSYKSLIVHFKTKYDFDNFKKLISQKITRSTKYIWFPDKIKNHLHGKVFKSES